MAMQLQRKLKKIVPLFCMLLCSPLAAALPQEMFTLLEVCGVQHDGSLSSIVEATQASWLRKPLQERWQQAELDFSPEKKQIVRDLIERMGFLKEMAPSSNHYTYCLLGGATSPAVQKRLNYVKSLWEKGLRFDQLVFLSGDRDLDPVLDKTEYDSGCKIEAEAMRYIYEATPLPDDMRAVPLVIVKAPKQNSPHGIIRPSRADTVRAWLALDPSPGTCMFVTHQPYVLYDHAVAENLLTPSHPFTTVGPGTMAEKNSVALLLDTVARYLYQKLEYEKTH